MSKLIPSFVSIVRLPSWNDNRFLRVLTNGQELFILCIAFVVDVFKLFISFCFRIYILLILFELFEDLKVLILHCLDPFKFLWSHYMHFASLGVRNIGSEILVVRSLLLFWNSTLNPFHMKILHISFVQLKFSLKWLSAILLQVISTKLWECHRISSNDRLFRLTIFLTINMIKLMVCVMVADDWEFKLHTRFQKLFVIIFWLQQLF
jgi:hypothetical protein